MLGERESMADELFVACSLRDLIPDDYILKKVDRVLDLSWLREEIAPLYCGDNGRPSIDPEAAVRLMLAGFFQGIVHDRKLMREAKMHIGMRWFAGFGLHETLPDHSSLTRLRQRWGAERFRKIFERTVAQCAAAGLIGGQTVHVDATLIRADVSWESLVVEHAERVLDENRDDGGAQENKANDNAEKSSRRGPGRPRTRQRSAKKRGTTDPDCSLTTSSKEFRMTPSYKQHTAVDDRAGVVLDAEVTTGETSEGQQLPEQIERVEDRLGHRPDCVTADAGYAHGRNWAQLERRGVEAVIPPQRAGKSKSVPIMKFKYDERNHTLRCPRGHKLRTTGRNKKGHVFRSKRRVCKSCALREDCVTASKSTRTIVIGDGYTAMLRARRKHARRTPEDVRRYRRHRWQVEGRHGEAKTQHGLARAVRRGLDNVRIQAYLTAAVMNLKRLAGVAAQRGGGSGRGWRGAVDAILGVMGAFFTGLMRIRCFGIILSEKQTDFVLLGDLRG